MNKKTKTNKKTNSKLAKLSRPIAILAGLSGAILLFGSTFFISYYALALLGITGILGVSIMVINFVILALSSSYVGLKFGAFVHKILQKIIAKNNAKKKEKSIPKTQEAKEKTATKEKKVKTMAKQKTTKVPTPKQIARKLGQRLNKRQNISPKPERGAYAKRQSQDLKPNRGTTA